MNVWSPRVSTALHKNLLGCLEIVESAKMANRALIWEMPTTFAINVVKIGGDLQEMEMSTDNCPVHNSVTLRTKWQNHCSSQPSSILYCHLLVRSFVVRLATIGFLCLHELLQPPNSPPPLPPNMILSEMSTVVRWSFYSQILNWCTFQEDNLVIASVWTCPMSKKELHNTPGYWITNPA